MTIDKARLKTLAETASAVTGDVSVDMTISSERGPNQDEIDAVTAFLGAATPAALLALLSEVERLTTSRSKKERELEQELEVWRNGPSCWNCGDTGDVHDITGEWRGECDCLSAQIINASRERDQLKAENEALRKALTGLLDLYDTDEGCRNLPQYIVGRAVLGQGERS